MHCNPTWWKQHYMASHSHSEVEKKFINLFENNTEDNLILTDGELEFLELIKKPLKPLKPSKSIQVRMYKAYYIWINA